MTEAWWIAIAGFALTIALAALSGLVAWMFNVSSNVGAIAANTDHLAKDNSYIREKVDEHAELLGELRTDVTKLEVSVSSLQQQLP